MFASVPRCSGRGHLTMTDVTMPDLAMTALPDATRRLFPGYEPEALTAPGCRDFLIARLLDEGDSDDLRWLFSQLGTDEVRQRLDGPCRGKLSARSERFWRLVLDLTPLAPPAAGDEIWPH